METFIKELIHPKVLNLAPYSPGKSITEIQEKYQLSKVIKLASNENCLGCSPQVLSYFNAINIHDIYLYPAMYLHPLSYELADFLKIEHSQLMLANGSDMIFSLIIQALALPQQKKILTHELAFMGYEKQASAYGLETIKAGICPKTWTINIKELIELAQNDVAVIFIANPNNPTGQVLAIDDICHILEAIPKTTLFVLDEAYFEYDETEKPDYPALLARYPNLIITRTFSKAYGLASLRLGYAFAHPDIITILKRIQLPFALGTLIMNAGLIALKDQRFITASKNNNLKEKKFLEQALKPLPFVCRPSYGNFITIEQEEDIMPLVHYLESKGVIIRPLHAFGLNKAARITIGTHLENQILIAELHHYLEDRPWNP